MFNRDTMPDRTADFSKVPDSLEVRQSGEYLYVYVPTEISEARRLIVKLFHEGLQKSIFLCSRTSDPRFYKIPQPYLELNKLVICID